MKLTRIVGVLMAVAALGLAACGDEEQDDQTKDELVEAANVVCVKFDKRLKEIDEPRNPRRTEQAAAYWDEAAPAIEAGYIELSALDPNDETEDDWNAFLAKQRELKDVSAKVARKTIKGDRSYINDLDEIASIRDDSNGLARTVGAERCVAEVERS